MAKSLSAATRLKISRSLRGNKNAFSGGPKKKLSTRDKIANINAATKAKKANLSSDQIARRASVAKRLRAQARREEALGVGTPADIVTNRESLDAARAKADRITSGALQSLTKAKTADDIRAATAQVKEARNELKKARRLVERRESQAKVQPSAKQNLNAPQTPPEQRTAALSPAQRRRQQRSKFEADQSAARSAPPVAKMLGNTRYKAIEEGKRDQGLPYNKRIAEGKDFMSEARDDDPIAPANPETAAAYKAKIRAAQQGGGPTEFARQQGAQVVDVPITGRGSRGGGIKKAPIQTDTKGNIVQRGGGKATTNDVIKAYAAKRERDKPQPPQSDTGTDRSGTFTKKVPVKGEKSTRSTGRKAIETEEDLQDFIAEKTPDIIRKLAKGIPQNDLRDLKAMIGKEMGAEGLDALNDILKG